MKLTYYGHACFGVEIDGIHILLDPFITANKKASHINVEEILADYILVSHGHLDHHADAPAIAKRTGATIVSNFEVATWFEEKGFKTHPMGHGGKWKFDFGTVKYVNAVHTSVMPDGKNGGNPGGFVIETSEGSFYHSGDTALTYDMKLIGEMHKLDFALLCIGDNFTMGYEDAAIAADFIQCDDIIGMHFDTFDYIVIDHEAATKHFQSKAKTLTIMEIGSVIQK